MFSNETRAEECVREMDALFSFGKMASDKLKIPKEKPIRTRI
jgi:hypothetical protein